MNTQPTQSDSLGPKDTALTNILERFERSVRGETLLPDENEYDLICARQDIKDLFAVKALSAPKLDETVESNDLTFEQQQEVSVILENFRNNPSNSNKYRYELFAWIAAHYAAKEQEAVLRARIDERLSTLATNDGKIIYVDGAHNPTKPDKAIGTWKDKEAV